MRFATTIIALAALASTAAGQAVTTAVPAEHAHRCPTVSELTDRSNFPRLKSGDYVQLLGYSAEGDDGGQPLRYDAQSAATVDDVFVFAAPGGTGRFLSVDPNAVTALQAGAAKDGATDDATRLQAYFDALSARATAESSTARAKAVLPAGRYAVASGIYVPINVDLDMRGASLVYTGSDYTIPVLTIGEDAKMVENGTYLGLSVGSQNSSHRYPYAGDDTFAGVRFKSVQNSRVTLGRFEYLNIAVQLFPNAAGSCTYNHFYGGSFLSCRIGVDLRGNTSSGFTNENTFYSFNYSATSVLNGYGSTRGVRFSAVASGYTGQNNNRFINCTFQPADLNTSYNWSSGKTGLVFNRRYRTSAGNEYVVTSAGDNQTGGTDEPTHTSGAATDNNGVEWTFIGRYYRVAVHHKGAGSNNIFQGARWESGYGPFAVLDGSIANYNKYEVYQADDNLLASPAIDDYTDSTVAGLAAIRNWIVPYDRVQSQSSVAKIDNIAYRAVGSASGWCVPGFAFYTVTAPDTIVERSTGGTQILGRDFLYMTGNRAIATWIDTAGGARRFIVKRDVYTTTGSRITFRAYDSTWTSQTIDASNKLLMSSYLLSSGTLAQGTDGDAPVAVLAPPSSTTRYIALQMGTGGIRLRGIQVEALPDRINTGGTVRLVTPFESSDGIAGRRSYGTPTSGHFRIAGERISNINTTAAQPLYWTVTAPGALAPAWAGATAVIEGELRENGGNVYYATAAGTTGATAPTHTSGSASDDTVTWQWLCAEATLTASSDTY